MGNGFSMGDGFGRGTTDDVRAVSDIYVDKIRAPWLSGGWMGKSLARVGLELAWYLQMNPSNKETAKTKNMVTQRVGTAPNRRCLFPHPLPILPAEGSVAEGEELFDARGS